MCLHIKPDQTQNEKDLNKWFGSRTKFAYVYKVLEKSPYESFYKSIYRSYFKWDFKKQQIYQVDRPLKPTKEELESGEIYIGFHVYTNLEVARINKVCDYDIVVKFQVKREDIVAVENDYFNKDYNLEELVCRKLTFIEVVKD
jgi:hypothetical protein